MALTDGTTVVPLASSQDHKRVGDGDTGPNTGGMGAYSPAPVLTPALEDEIMATIMHPVVAGLAADGIVYRGVLYAGLMIANGKPKVLEFNVRFGDPECQVLMMRLRSDLIDLVDATIDGTLAGCRPEWDPRPSAGVVLAAEGYPGEPAKGDVIARRRRPRLLDRAGGLPRRDHAARRRRRDERRAGAHCVRPRDGPPGRRRQRVCDGVGPSAFAACTIGRTSAIARSRAGSHREDS